MMSNCNHNNTFVNHKIKHTEREFFDHDFSGPRHSKRTR